MTLAAPANLEIVDQPQRAGVLMHPMRRDKQPGAARKHQGVEHRDRRGDPYATDTG